MFADAFASEAYRLWRNRTAWFWGFVFVPLLSLLAGLFGEMVIRPKMLKAGADLGGMNMLGAIGMFGKLAFQPIVLFGLIAASILFAGEYRWETWRLLAPRNSRINLIAAKMLVFAIGAAFMLVAIDLAGLVSALAGAAVTHEPVTWGGPPSGAFLLPLLEQLLVAWAQLLQIGALAALVAVLTRSIIGALVVPIVIMIAQGVVTGLQQTTSLVIRAFESPGVAADVLRAFLQTRTPDGQSAVATDLVVQAGISLLAWMLIAAIMAVVAFRQQDLAKE